MENDVLDALAEIDAVLIGSYGPGRDGVHAAAAAYRACLERFATPTTYKATMDQVAAIPERTGILEPGRILRAAVTTVRHGIARGVFQPPPSTQRRAATTPADAARKQIDARQRVLIALSEKAGGQMNYSTTVDDVAALAGLPTGDVLTAILHLSSSGLARNLQGMVLTTAAGIEQAEAWAIERSRDQAEPAVNRSQGPKMHESRTRIFISHSAADAEVAEKLAHLIEAHFDVPEHTIRCTSVVGYKLEGGDDPAQVLRRDIETCDVVVALLTPASIKSKFVLMELGAAWAFETRAIPLLASGMDFDDLPGPFGDLHALRMTDRSDLASLMSTVGREASLPRRDNGPKAVAAEEKFLAAAAAAMSSPAAFSVEPAGSGS